MDFKVAVLPGDGIGPDIIEQAIVVLENIGKIYNHRFTFEEFLAGGIALDKLNNPLPQATIDGCLNSDSVLLGAVGGPQWDHLSGDQRPERALLGLRAALGLYANIRPAVLHEPLKDACPLKEELTDAGIDICVIRELTGGIYFGQRGRRKGEFGEEAYDTESYSVKEVERIARTAFQIAKTRNRHVTNVDKANVLESSRLWRSVVIEVAKDYPDVKLEHMYVDNASMQLIRNPRQFDVIVTTNMFGDILSDEASMLTGSIGMLPSASLGETKLGLYEPIHGSAPDIAGQDIANPIATILSVAMMLRHSFELEDEASAIENAVTRVLEQGYRTQDITSTNMQVEGTKEMGTLITSNLT